ncbi:MAG: 3'-5' exonuclease [Thermodesulfobacteriota bacterium]
MNKIILDTETTGMLKPSVNGLLAQPHMIEIFCCKIDDEFNLIDEFYSLIKPPIPIPKLITKITGIDDEMVKDAPSFIKIYLSLAEFFQDTDVMVAHNLSFDRDIVANELKRIDKLLNFPWPIHHYCTVEESIHIKGYRLKLAQLHKMATGNMPVGMHRAKDDVYTLIKCYHWLLEREGWTIFDEDED